MRKRVPARKNLYQMNNHDLTPLPSGCQAFLFRSRLGRGTNRNRARKTKKRRSPKASPFYVRFSTRFLGSRPDLVNPDLHLYHVLNGRIGIGGPGIADEIGINLEDAAFYDIFAVEVAETSSF